jgi:hypothetical protein
MKWKYGQFGDAFLPAARKLPRVLQGLNRRVITSDLRPGGKLILSLGSSGTPLWISGQSYWIHTQRSWVRFPPLPVCLECGPLSLVRINELLERKSSGPCLENRN